MGYRVFVLCAAAAVLVAACDPDAGADDPGDEAAPPDDPGMGEAAPDEPDDTEAPDDARADDARDPAEPPDWAREARIYHVFTDRFRDGDPGNNVDVDPDADGSLSEALRNWMGGDLAGVIEGLDHIEAAGFDTVWLGPVTENAYFHGYHATDFLDVDENFGDLDELRDLVDEAHARGMRVVYDLVPNHTSDQHPWFQDALAECEGSEYYDWYTFTHCDAEAGEYDYATFFGLDELPQLDLAHEPARDYFTEHVVPFYLSDGEVALPDGSTTQGLGMDGFRLDHATGPGMAFWEAFAVAVADANPEAYVFGEVWDSEYDALARYRDVFHGAVDFPLYFAVDDALAGIAGLDRIDRVVRDGLDVDGDGFVAPTFLDNHDVERFAHAAGGGDEGRARLAVALTVQYALPGPPVVYYGTEIGMGQSDRGPIEGTLEWEDRWYREPFPWTQDLAGGEAEWVHADEVDGWTLQAPDLDVLDRVRKLSEARDATPALVHGTYETVGAERDLLAFERTYEGQRVLALVHDGDDAVDASLAELYGDTVPDGVALDGLLGEDRFTATGGDVEVPLGALDATLLAVDGDLPAPPGD